jgi:hypothetical protein
VLQFGQDLKSDLKLERRVKTRVVVEQRDVSDVDESHSKRREEKKKKKNTIQTSIVFLEMADSFQTTQQDTEGSFPSSPRTKKEVRTK